MAQSEHNTLTASTVATVTLDSGSYDTVLVTNRSGSNPLYVTVDGSVPTVAGDDTFVVPAAAGASKAFGWESTGAVTVKIISAGAEDYSVEAR